MPDTDIKDYPKSDSIPLMIGLLIINLFWGGSFIANAIALKYIGPIEIASLRFFIAAPLLAIATYLWKGRQIFKINMGDMGVLILMAITGVTLQYIIQVSAQKYTSATNASLLINTSVFFIMIFSAMFLKETMNAKKVAGAIIGFAGVALLVSNGSLSFDIGGHATGDIMIMVCALLWAVYSIYGKKISSKYHPLTILNYVFIIGTLGFIPFYLITPHSSILSIPASAMVSILFLSIFCSIIAYLVYSFALEKMNASTVAIYIYFVPLSTIVLAALILGETLTIASVAGGLLVLIGMYLAQ